MATQSSPPGVRVVGFQWARSAHDVKDFLARNRVAYAWIDAERDPRARPLMEAHGARTRDLPLVLFPDGSALLSPTVQEVAERIGLSTEAESPI